MSKQQPKKKTQKTSEQPSEVAEKKQKQWKLIASADDDMIDGEILTKLGLYDLWQKHDLWADDNFVDAVLENCDSARIDRDSWDGGAPGRSGVWHEIYTDDLPKLRKQARAAILSLVEEKG